MLVRTTLLGLSVLLALRPGCGRYTPKKEQPAEEHKIPAWCHEGSMNCYNGCFKRKEGQACGSCCHGQLILCDENRAYDFAHCDTAERDGRSP